MKLTLDFKGGGNMFPFQMSKVFYHGCFLGEENSDKVCIEIKSTFLSFCNEMKDDYSNAEPIELDFSGATKDYLFQISNSAICTCDEQIKHLNKDISNLQGMPASILPFLNRNLEIISKIKSQFIELRDYATKLS
jgi:hypothetical protein